jgi:hypothetical protein
MSSCVVSAWVLLQILLLGLFCNAPCRAVQLDCNLILKQYPSGSSFGIGVFAGKSYIRGEILERSVAILLPHHVVKGSVVDNYVFTSRLDGFSTLVLGFAMLYNHRPSSDNQIGMYMNPEHVVSPRTTNETLDFTMEAERTISPREEIYSNYGESSWFEDRGVAYSDALKPSDNDVAAAKSLPGCPHQLTEIVGNRVYARQ